MSVKCSLFGHRYGDTEVERDREQTGNELVERVRKIKVCHRCGTELVISESKEVTTVEADTEESGETDGHDETTRPAAPGRVSAPTGGNPGSEQQRHGDTDGPAVTGRESSREDDDPVAPEMDDHDVAHPEEDDAVILDDDRGDDTPGTAWPDSDEQADDGWTPEGPVTGSDTDHGDTPAEASTGGLTVPEGEFSCPECDFRTTVESSSLREGDFCPSCHHGALEHHNG